MSRDPALPRFLALQAMRLVGAVAALAGVVVLSGGQPALAGIPAPLGYGLFAIGVLLFFAGPVGLARKWKKWGKGPE
ncbi:hypothetical protein Y88_3220 [Novosphingobium nitrogenifigens DSM 19370]|uniref:Transmembrane protein n=1 Tax=Novosphingobium nitrogenifigens DSM 19370 TaxID=983920 RepID=F1ZBM4_9SPHN|nr:hypothetical protein [Novosphingobium nitrogenifigens]EGD57890.1 hypothetical protein Y88_3220 [Novosphingobium nitrogenifigens DSM 19370]